MSRRILVALALAVAACGGGSSDGSADEAPPPGREIFAERILGANAGCITCHSLDPDTTLVGPSIAGIATRAATRVPGQTAETYLRQSIIDPGAFVVDGFEPGRMPGDWGEVLTDGEVESLVAYLLTLG